LITEYCRAAMFLNLRNSVAKLGDKTLAIENIVAQDQTNTIITDELFTDNKRLGEPIRTGLHCIAEVDTELLSCTQCTLEPCEVIRCCDNENIPDPCQHEHGQGVIDHGFI